jgi:KDO2-lipid IV(A) lauroyltransferase
LGLSALPGWQQRVGSAMLAALGEGVDRSAPRRYFQRLADVVVMSAAVYRDGYEAAGASAWWDHDDASRTHYEEALSPGRGALMVGPHLTGTEIMVGGAAREVPITVLIRKSPEPEYEAMKQRWYEALGLDVVYRPRRSEDPQGLNEMAAAVRVLRKNRILAITPDLLQRPGTGIPVRLFGRTAELPAGAFYLSVRLGAPLLPSFFHHSDGKYHLWTAGQLAPPDPSLDRDAAIRSAAQAWTDRFEQFVREHPEMWQFWLDKRWSAWLLGTPAEAATGCG